MTLNMFLVNQYLIIEDIFEKRGWHIFLVVYAAQYLSGGIQLSPEHNGFQWIDPSQITLKKSDFMNAGEYFAFMKYFGLPASNY